MDIDLNSDIGEGFGAYTLGDDAGLLKIISSANVACGFHAGDPVIMDKTVRLALAQGVDLGAHVGFPDLMGFGRRPMHCDPAEVAMYVLYQLGALAGFASVAGGRITHMSFHGALGNMAAADYALAEPLVRTVAEFNPDMIISVSTNTQIERAARQFGLKVATTFLADRAYTDEGDLVPRKLPARSSRIRPWCWSGSNACWMMVSSPASMGKNSPFRCNRSCCTGIRQAPSRMHLPSAMKSRQETGR